jgi:repressor of nif and glnA expression
MEYAGCSLDPSEVFTAGKMSSVAKTAREGNGKVLASFCEVPAVAHSDTEIALRELEKVGIQSLVVTGKIGESVCQIPVTANRFGMVLVDGLNPIAAAMEAGLKVINHSMSGTIEFEKLRHFKDCRLI